MIDFFLLESTSTVLGFMWIGSSFDGEVLKIRLLVAGNWSRRRRFIVEGEMRFLIATDSGLLGLNEGVCIFCQFNENGLLGTNTADSTSNRRFLWWFRRSIRIVENSLMLKTTIRCTRFGFRSFFLCNIMKTSNRSLFRNFISVSTDKFVSGCLFGFTSSGFLRFSCFGEIGEGEFSTGSLADAGETNGRLFFDREVGFFS